MKIIAKLAAAALFTFSYMIIKIQIGATFMQIEGL